MRLHPIAAIKVRAVVKQVVIGRRRWFLVEFEVFGFCSACYFANCKKTFGPVVEGVKFSRKTANKQGKNIKIGGGLGLSTRRQQGNLQVIATCDCNNQWGVQKIYFWALQCIGF